MTETLAEPQPAVPTPPSWRPSLGVVDRAALALILLQLVWRAWAAYTDYFAADDFAYLYSAEHHSLDWGYLTQDYNGHLMPGQFVVVWLLQHAAPLSWPAAATVLLALQAAVDVAVWRLLRTAFGTPQFVLLPLVVFLFSPLTMASYLWWAAALQMLPMLLAMAVTVRAHLLYFRSGRRSDGLTALVAYGLGLLFWEKALLILPLVVGLSLLFPVNSPRPLLRSVFWHRRRLWAGYALVSVAYLWLYFATVGWPLAGHAKSGASGSLIREMVVSAFVPGAFGGPWSDRDAGTGLVPAPGTLVTGVLVGCLVIVVGSSIWLRRDAIKAWLLLAGYLALDALLLAGGRLHLAGPVLGRDTRYVADAVLVTSFALGLAFLPLLEERGERSHRVAPLQGRPALVAMLIVVYLTSCWVTTSKLVHGVQSADTKAFVGTARADLRAIGDPIVLHDGTPPKSVLSPLLFAQARYSRLLAGAPEDPAYDVPTDQLYTLDDSGHVRPFVLREVTTSVPGPVSGCGYAVDQRGATVLLAHPAFAWDWVVKLSYFTSSPTPGVLHFGGTDVPVQFQAGLHDLYVSVPAGFDRMGVSGLNGGSVVCVANVGVGTEDRG